MQIHFFQMFCIECQTGTRNVYVLPKYILFLERADVDKLTNYCNNFYLIRYNVQATCAFDIYVEF